MPYESMPNLAELRREAGEDFPFESLSAFRNGDKLPEDVPCRVSRSAAFMVGLCEIMDTTDPEAAFRDALRELQHAAVEFGVNWTDEDRQGWREVQDERARLGCSGAYKAPY